MDSSFPMHAMKLILKIRMAFLLPIVVIVSRAAVAATPADMPPDSWLEIPDSAMKKVAADMEKFPKVRAVCGPSAVIDAWGGGALDTKRNRLVLWGGGHADYWG